MKKNELVTEKWIYRTDAYEYFSMTANEDYWSKLVPADVEKSYREFSLSPRWYQEV